MIYDVYIRIDKFDICYTDSDGDTP